MTNATTRLLLAGLLIVLPAGAAKAIRALPAGGDNACSESAVTIYVRRGAKTDVEQDARAIYVATRAFQSIGIRLHWRGGKPTTTTERDCGETIGLQIDPVGDERFPPDVMGYAAPMATSGTRIHIFYDRVSAHSSRIPNLFGYVMAHEIGHVLQGTPRHSTEGIMKARWNAGDHNAMNVYGLKFTLTDAALILEGAKLNRGIRAPGPDSQETPGSLAGIATRRP